MKLLRWVLVLACLVGCQKTAAPPPLPQPGEEPGNLDPRDVQPYAAVEAADPRERAVGVELLVAAKLDQAERGRRLRELLGDPAGPVRAAAVDGLRRTGGSPEDITAVRAREDDDDPRVRAEVVRFLAGHAGSDSLPRLQRFFREDDDERVRALALTSLAVLGVDATELEAARSLHAAGEQTPPLLRAAVSQYLCQHAARLGDDAVPILSSLLGADDPRVRAGAARALGDRGAPAAAALARAFASEPQPTVAAEMLLAHARAGAGELGGECRRLLSSRSHWLVESAAAKYLGAAAKPGAETASLLQLALFDPARDPRVRQAAALSLAALGETTALEQGLEHDDSELRRLCLLAYPQGDREHLLQLAGRCSIDRDPEVAWAALVVRAGLRDSTAYPEIVEGMRTSFAHASDALRVLLEITGGTPNHGLDYEAWRGWVTAQGG